MKKSVLFLLLTISVSLYGCQNKGTDDADSFVSEIMENTDNADEEDEADASSAEDISQAEDSQSAEEGTESSKEQETENEGRNISHENPDGDDFNTDGLMMDKVRIEDFSYLYDQGLTYYHHVELQARLSRYLDYYVPSDDDQIWTVTILQDEGFADVPLLYQFYVYVEELDATIKCQIYKEEDVKYPYRFSCEKLDSGENE